MADRRCPRGTGSWPLHSAALALHIHAPSNHVHALPCAAILLMTMALVVAMVACQGAVGPAGPPGPPAETPTTPTTPTTSTPAGPTVTTPIADMTLLPGTTATFDLSKNFSGAIGYSVVSDMPAIVLVTAIVPAGTTLTVTAGTEEGVAKVTVTASDSVDAATAKIVTDTFKVTVSSAVIPVTSGPITLDVSKDQVVKVGAGETLKSADIQIVIVEDDAKVGEYKVTAVKKGTTTLEVLKDDAVARTIAVTVNNQAPMRNKTTLPVAPYQLAEATVDGVNGVADGGGDLTAAQSKMLGDVKLYKLVVPGDPPDEFEGLSTYFDDADNDTLTFASAADRTNHVVVAGYKKDGNAIFVDMLQKDPTINLFNLVTHAMDAGKPGDPLSSTKERLKVETNKPLPQEYTVAQHSDNHNFIELDKIVGLRKDVDHRMRFEGGFTFTGITTINATTLLEKPADGDMSYLTINATGAASVGKVLGTTLTDDDDTGVLILIFKVTATGAATVTVTYHQFGDHDNDTSSDEEYFDPVMRTLRFSVVAVTQKPVAL